MWDLTRRSSALLLAAAFAAPQALAQSPGATATGATALDRYVAKIDPVYAWRLVRTVTGPGQKTFVLELASQTWRSPAEVDKPVWKHWITLVVPDNAISGKALLYIDGGQDGDPAPSEASPRQLKLALETGGISAEVRMVPNQPLRFSDSPAEGRSEDDLIAYSRIRRLTTSDDTWLVRLAMVKSGVRALDAIQAFLASPAGGRQRVNEFVVAGGSKRGWTAWLVAAVDPRVIAVMPIVIDALNSEAITRHQFEAYGEFGPALQDYVDHGLFPHRIGSRGYEDILAIEDPFRYRARPRLRMPKYLINASGDQFFLPDNSRFYYGALPEEKRIRYVPNARHNLADTDAQESMAAFYYAILRNIPRPAYSWTRRDDGALVVRSATRPAEVTLWQAHNPKARDFRVDTIGKAYRPRVLSREADGSWVGKIETPRQGYTATFVELAFDIGGPHPIKYTTEVAISPDTLPFKWEDAAKRYPSNPAPGAR